MFFIAEYARVFGIARLAAGDQETGRDAAQEAFARAFARWGRLTGQPWARAWVVTTALNEVRHINRRRAPPIEPEPDAQDDPDIAQGLDVVRAIRTLPRRQQEAIVLHYLADLPLSEVSVSMGCSVGAVKAHLSRARSALSMKLEGAR